MPIKASFRVDPRLASLLGEGYRSSEEALKELVDNAWDADASTVRVTLPGEVTKDAITVEDDGTGMTDRELREEYLVVARDRRSRIGLRTVGKKREVKGRKGIGKFAGLMAAAEMQIETRARGKKTTLTITKADLQKSANERGADLEKIDLPVRVEECAEDEHGTTITLTSLSQALAFPSADQLKQLLVIEYGREHDFAVFVNGVQTGIDDIPGKTFEERIERSRFAAAIEVIPRV